MPRKPRNPGSGKPPFNGPAQGEGMGPGWGGPAKGEGNPKGEPGPGRPVGVPDGQGKKARARAMLEDAVPLAIQTVVNIAGNVEDQRSLAAALSILNRTGLHEKSAVEVDGGLTVKHAADEALTEVFGVLAELESIRRGGGGGPDQVAGESEGEATPA
jgi:hypothetical protein